MSGGCYKYSANCLCYVCGEIFAKKHCLESCIYAKEVYHAYFGMPVVNQDKPWATHIICEYCRRTLEGWFIGEKSAVRFPIPRVWREPSNHFTDCYFCMVNPCKWRKGKNALSTKWLDIASSIAPVPHNTTDMPVPQPYLRDEPFITDASSTDSETEQLPAACARCQLLVKGAPTTTTKKILMILAAVFIDKVEYRVSHFQT